MDLLEQDGIKLLISLFIGSVLGAEREYRGKPAGFRTIILICVSSTLFTIMSLNIGDPASHDRIAANILTGIGFLGAGAIFRNEDHVIGLTTAVTIWVVSAIGMAIGSGYHYLGIIVAAMVLVVLVIFPKLGDMIERINKVRTYTITIQNKDNQGLTTLENCFRDAALKFKNSRIILTPGQLCGIWEVQGTPSAHQRLILILSANTQIVSVEL